MLSVVPIHASWPVGRGVWGRSTGNQVMPSRSGSRAPQVDEFDVGHFVGLNEDAVVAVEGELLVFEVVVVPLGKGAAFSG